MKNLLLFFLVMMLGCSSCEDIVIVYPNNARIEVGMVGYYESGYPYPWSEIHPDITIPAGRVGITLEWEVFDYGTPGRPHKNQKDE
jgi:hypothetical protein